MHEFAFSSQLSSLVIQSHCFQLRTILPANRMSLHLPILLQMDIFTLTAPSLEPIFPDSHSSQLLALLHSPSRQAFRYCCQFIPTRYLPKICLFVLKYLCRLGGYFQINKYCSLDLFMSITGYNWIGLLWGNVLNTLLSKRTGFCKCSTVIFGCLQDILANAIYFSFYFNQSYIYKYLF